MLFFQFFLTYLTVTLYSFKKFSNDSCLFTSTSPFSSSRLLVPYTAGVSISRYNTPKDHAAMSFVIY